MKGAAADEILARLTERGLSTADPAAAAMAREELGAAESVLEELFGHGPLTPYLRDIAVTEILVNGPDEIWVERGGCLQRISAGAFTSEESLRRYARRLLSPSGRKVDQRSPFADCVIEGGVRVHVAAPPVSRRGLCISLRKPPATPWTLASLCGAGAFSEATEARLSAYVAEGRNIFVSGGTGSGKTSLLGALVGEVSPGERVVLLEDVAEIRTGHRHCLSLEARGANQEGEGAIPLRNLLKEALRMRPDRLIVGECRGSEALDLLLALNTGHRGSMGTIHANGPRDALARLELLALLAAENLRESALKQLVAASVHVVIHLERDRHGRRVRSIAELRGVDGGNYLLKETVFP